MKEIDIGAPDEKDKSTCASKEARKQAKRSAPLKEKPKKLYTSKVKKKRPTTTPLISPLTTISSIFPPPSPPPPPPPRRC